MNLTYADYDRLQDELLQIPNHDPSWWPDVQDITNSGLPEERSFLEFLLWLTLTANPPQSESGKASRRFINQILYRTIILED